MEKQNLFYALFRPRRLAYQQPEKRPEVISGVEKHKEGEKTVEDAKKSVDDLKKREGELNLEIAAIKKQFDETGISPERKSEFDKKLKEHEDALKKIQNSIDEYNELANEYAKKKKLIEKGTEKPKAALNNKWQKEIKEMYKMPNGGLQKGKVMEGVEYVKANGILYSKDGTANIYLKYEKGKNGFKPVKVDSMEIDGAQKQQKKMDDARVFLNNLMIKGLVYDPGNYPLLEAYIKKIEGDAKAGAIGVGKITKEFIDAVKERLAKKAPKKAPKKTPDKFTPDAPPKTPEDFAKYNKIMERDANIYSDPKNVDKTISGVVAKGEPIKIIEGPIEVVQADGKGGTRTDKFNIVEVVHFDERTGKYYTKRGYMKAEEAPEAVKTLSPDELKKAQEAVAVKMNELIEKYTKSLAESAAAIEGKKQIDANPDKNKKIDTPEAKAYFDLQEQFLREVYGFERIGRMLNGKSASELWNEVLKKNGLKPIEEMKEAPKKKPRKAPAEDVAKLIKGGVYKAFDELKKKSDALVVINGVNYFSANGKIYAEHKGNFYRFSHEDLANLDMSLPIEKQVAPIGFEVQSFLDSAGANAYRKLMFNDIKKQLDGGKPVVYKNIEGTEKYFNVKNDPDAVYFKHPDGKYYRLGRNGKQVQADVNNEYFENLERIVSPNMKLGPAEYRKNADKYVKTAKDGYKIVNFKNVGGQVDKKAESAIRLIDVVKPLKNGESLLIVDPAGKRIEAIYDLSRKDFVEKGSKKHVIIKDGYKIYHVPKIYNQAKDFFNKKIF